MILREAAKQSEHDTVVEQLAAVYQNNGFEVWTNPGHDHNHIYRGLWPDVRVLARKTKSKDGEIQKRFWLFEVETSDTVAEGEAEQWSTYNGLFAAWYLVVPSDSSGAAAAFKARDRLTACRIVTYLRARSGGGYTFTGLPGIDK